MHGHPRSTLIDLTDLLNVAKIQLGMKSLAEHIQGHGNDVQVASSFAIANKVPSTRSAPPSALIQWQQCQSPGRCGYAG